jgi:hypothetical protein
MKITSKSATAVFNWLDTKKIKYKIDPFKSDPIHGKYCLTFADKQEELMTRLRWGIA